MTGISQLAFPETSLFEGPGYPCPNSVACGRGNPQKIQDCILFTSNERSELEVIIPFQTWEKLLGA